MLQKFSTKSTNFTYILDLYLTISVLSKEKSRMFVGYVGDEQTINQLISYVRKQHHRVFKYSELDDQLVDAKKDNARKRFREERD